MISLTPTLFYFILLFSLFFLLLSCSFIFFHLVFCFHTFILTLPFAFLALICSSPSFLIWYPNSPFLTDSCYRSQWQLRIELCLQSLSHRIWTVICHGIKYHSVGRRILRRYLVMMICQARCLFLFANKNCSGHWRFKLAWALSWTSEALLASSKRKLDLGSALPLPSLLLASPKATRILVLKGTKQGLLTVTPNIKISFW